MKSDSSSQSPYAPTKKKGLLGQQHGVTLTEVLIVCAIIGILAAVAVPGIMSMLPHWRLKGAARQLTSDMQDTRLQAIRSNQPWAIVFDAANNIYSICSANGADNDWSTVADNTVRRTINLTPDNLTYGVGNATQPVINPPPVPFPPLFGIDYLPQLVVFNPQGTIGSTGFVYLQNQNNSAYAVGTQTSGVIMIRHWGGVWD